MKNNKIIPIWILVSVLFSSCDDQIMEWDKDPNKGEVTVAQLPLELSEKVLRYDPLNTYTDLIVGVGAGLDLYMNKDVYRNTANENFDEITVGYAMKHGPMVNSDGTLSFGAVDGFMDAAKSAGMTVFGHTLVWHSNQNASYLNGLIAPTVIPGAGGSNSLDLSGLQDGSFSGWANWNSGAGITIEDGKGLTATSKAVQMISSTGSSEPWSLQLGTPEIPIVSGHTYQISFFIKSDKPGKGRISFSGLDNNYPYKDWYNTGGEWTEAFETSSTWQQVQFTVNDFTGDVFQIYLDLGYVGDVTYWIDLESMQVVDQDAEPTIVNMVTNGDFESGLDGWGKYNGNDPTHVTGTDAYEGDGAMRVDVDANDDGAQWRAQIHADFTATLTLEETYTISFLIRSESAGSVRCSTTGEARYQGDQATSSTWTSIVWEITSNGGETGLNFDLGKIPGTYYIDNVVVSNGEASSGGSGPIVIEKTEEEKTALIGASMEDWISQMVGHYKDDVKAWDVVNEPMKEDGTLRDGNVSDLADDQFYWVKYLGQDYAVTAFNLAREYGNPDDIHFINDYNLEYSLDKCDGLIEYVQYIESQGARVDGIGTQMHISADSDKDKIAQMFQKLANSQKLIKVSELDVRLGTNSPTVEQMAAQAEMYQYVIDKYRELIPAEQQYGITIWGVSDNADEHEFWLPDESPNLWDANFNRKHAYKGACDGFAGRDVSEDFTGELEF